MSTLLGIVVSIVGLGFLILVHEFGHFIVAKLTGMRVEEFSLGFGPYLVSRRIGETVYGISAFPLGGYVRVTGMHEEEFYAQVAEARRQAAEEHAAKYDEYDDDFDIEDDSGLEVFPEDTERRPAQDPEDRLAGDRTLTPAEIAATPLERRYYAHPFWHKLLFIVAGVVMNMIAAFLLLFCVGLIQGESSATTIVEAVESGSPAAAAGLAPGDKIVAINGKATTDWEELRTEILSHPGEQISIVVERGEKQVELAATPKKQEDGTGFLGIQPQTQHKDLGVLASFGFAGRATVDMFVLTLQGIAMMFAGDVPVTGSQGLAGPVGIIQLSTEAVQGGYYLALLALISINLAILNMIPLLPLDGGHVLLSIIERIRGKSISLRTFERISMVGLALFGLLFLVATSNDIGRLLGG